MEQIHCDRLVIDLDQVPKIPRPFMGYKHVGRKIKLCDSKDLTRLDKINPTKIHHYSNYLKSILGRGINLFRSFRILNLAIIYNHFFIRLFFIESLNSFEVTREKFIQAQIEENSKNSIPL